MNIDELRSAKEAKFHEIVAFIAKEFGYGSVDELAPAIREQVEGEAENAVENWDEEEPVGGHAIKYPLQKLLAEHHEICEQILDWQDKKTIRWRKKHGLDDPD